MSSRAVAGLASAVVVVAAILAALVGESAAWTFLGCTLAGFLVGVAYALLLVREGGNR